MAPSPAETPGALPDPPCPEFPSAQCPGAAPGAPRAHLEHEPAHAEHHPQQVHVVRGGVFQRRVGLGGRRFVPGGGRAAPSGGTPADVPGSAAPSPLPPGLSSLSAVPPGHLAGSPRIRHGPAASTASSAAAGRSPAPSPGPVPVPPPAPSSVPAPLRPWRSRGRGPPGPSCPGSGCRPCSAGRERCGPPASTVRPGGKRGTGEEIGTRGWRVGTGHGVPVWGSRGSAGGPGISPCLGQRSRGSRPFPPAADGNYCLTCGSDKTLKLWNPHKGTALRTYQGHGYEVLDAAG